MVDTERIVILAARRGARGDLDTGSLEWGIIRGEVDDLLARADITKLDDVPDVAAASPTSGQFLKWNGSAWVPAAVTSGIPYVKSAGVTTVEENVTTLDFGASFTATNPTDGWVAVVPSFGGSGTSPDFARADHTHTTASKTYTAYTGGGYLSSGSRAIGSTNVTLADGVTYLVEAWPEGQLRGADAGAAYYTISVTIDGNTRTSTAGKKWVVQGVPNDPNWSHARTITGTGAAIAISASVTYSSGAGLNVDDGHLVVRLTPNR